MAFNVQQHFYGLNLSGQRPVLSTGGPSTGRDRNSVTPYPYITGFFSAIAGGRYGSAASNASPQPWNNRYARPLQLNMQAWPIQKPATYTSVSF